MCLQSRQVSPICFHPSTHHSLFFFELLRIWTEASLSPHSLWRRWPPKQEATQMLHLSCTVPHVELGSVVNFLEDGMDFQGLRSSPLRRDEGKQIPDGGGGLSSLAFFTASCPPPIIYTDHTHVFAQVLTAVGIPPGGGGSRTPPIQSPKRLNLKFFRQNMCVPHPSALSPVAHRPPSSAPVAVPGHTPPVAPWPSRAPPWS